MSDDNTFRLILLIFIALLLPFGLYCRIRSHTNWFIFLTAIIVFGFLVARTGIEEAKLVERFGNEYRDYVRKTGRFFPRLRW